MEWISLTRPQILAWNGGGSSNVSAIFGDQHVSIKPSDSAAEMTKNIEQFEDFVKSELENVENFFDELK